MIPDPRSVSIRALYGAMEGERQPYLERARDVARLTTPGILPAEGATSQSERDTPYSAIGARGLNSLASSVFQASFPAGTPFFRIVPTPEAEAAMEGVEGAREEVDASLAQYEFTIASDIERRGYRGPIGVAVRHLLAIGNILIRCLPNEPMRLYRLDSYVQRRYPDGRPKTVIVKEMVGADKVPDELRLLCPPDDVERELWELYSRIDWSEKRGGEVTMKQETCGSVINEVSWSADACPYLPQTWLLEPGAHYGRSFCEDFIGELETLDALTESIVHGSAVAAEVRCLVNPTGVTELSAMKAPNLSVRAGRAEDVTFAQANKHGDFATAYQVVKDSQERLAQIFLMPEASIRNKDRVTATEIRMLQESTDRVTAGNTSMRDGLQLPLVRLVATQLSAKSALPKLPKDVVDTVILTGADALARNMETLRMDAFIQDLGVTFGPEAVQLHIKVDQWLAAKRDALQLSRIDFLRTQAEIQQMQQEAMQQQVVAEAASAGAATAGAAAGEQLVNPPQPQEA